MLNIDPVAFHIGPLAVHWYGLGYVLAMLVAMRVTLCRGRRIGIHSEQGWGIFGWALVAGLVGGRLYFVVQQPDLASNYLEKPVNIIAAWNGGMAFFGAIFLGAAAIFLVAPHYGLSRMIALDGAALFAAVGQIFGRLGNIINGGILGSAAIKAPIHVPPGVCAHAPCPANVPDPHIHPAWNIVYLNSHSLAPLSIPFQPAPVYEMLFNPLALAILWRFRYSLPRRRAGLLFILYLMLYAVGQFGVFFFRSSEPITPLFGIDVLKQAQWTAIFLLLACAPIYLLVRRYSRA